MLANPDFGEQRPNRGTGPGEEQPSAIERLKEWDRKIDAMLVDIQNQAAARERAAAEAPPGTNDPGRRSYPILPSSYDLPANDPQAIQEVTTAMRELTAEIRQFRTQLEEGPYPRGKTAPGAEEESTQPAEKADAGEKPPPGERKKSNKALTVISNILFYMVIVGLVLGAFLMRSTNRGQPFMLAGYSAANVLTSSMEDVYPRGSLIITRQVEAGELQVGDDITFMVSEDASVTHRIIGITENYQGSGQRAFETKGTMNPNPDKDMVAAVNVVGKVVFSSKLLGDLANFVKANWPILIFVLVVIIGLISFLKWNAGRGDDTAEEPPKKDKKPAKSKKKKQYQIPKNKNSRKEK